jgi:hypothetical protein
MALMLLAIWYWGPLALGEYRKRFMLYAMWCAELFYWLPTGRKEDIILTVVSPLIVRYLWTKRMVNWRYALLIVAGIIVLFPASHYYRLAVDLWGEAGIPFDQRIFTALEAANDNDLLGDLAPGQVLLGRLSLVEPVAASVRLVDEGAWSLQLGASYSSFLIGLVPRALWADKPTFSYGTEFGHRSGILDTGDDVTSISVTLFGESFLNFGVAGALVSLCIGVIFGVIYRWFRNSRREDALFLYVASLKVVVYVGGTFTLYFLGLVKTLLICALFLVCLRVNLSLKLDEQSQA